MKILFKAGNSANAGLLFIRLSLGLLFLLAGAKKILNLQEFIESVQAMGKMSDNAAFILAFVLPFMELVFGGLYMIGLFTPLTSIAIAGMCISFIAVQGPWHYELPFSHNFVFLACALATLVSGAGRISFDALVDKGGTQNKKTVNTESDQIIRPDVTEVPAGDIEKQVEVRPRGEPPGEST
ncbi:MAG: DoxX family protein [Ignavibacteria bacterium]|nr:DoxX family protein [Ignavibacteria bacterium]